MPICALSTPRLRALRHPLDVHHFLVIRAVVVHHAQQRDAVVRRRPERARRVHQIAVGLDAHREPAVPRLASAAPTAAGAL